MARTIDREERKQFRVLLNPVRQDIIHLLRRAGRPMTANTVAEKMLLSPSAAQSHLNKLEELGVVELGVYTAPDGRQATYYRLADVEIRPCLGRKDGFQGEREALAAQLVDGPFRGVLHAASQCGEPEQQEDLQFLFGALHLKPEERAELLERCTARFPNVEVDFSDELLAAYAKRRKAHVVVKGLRAVSDYENELQMALINRKLNPRLETMFQPSSAKYTYVSSSMVKEMARYGAELSDFVPREIIGDVQRKMDSRRDG